MSVQAVEMNIGSIIYDSLERKTVNGIPVGFLSPSYPRIVGGDGKPPPIDVNKIIETFHSKEGNSVSCVYSGLPADGISAVDGNPSNFLITNLEPINKGFIKGLPPLPKGILTKIFSKCGTSPHLFDLELEVLGLAFLVEEKLDKLVIPDIPAELGLAYAEAELLWFWNDLTKRSLLKGLTKLTMHNRATDTSVSLLNQDVIKFVISTLQNRILEKEQEND